ncbi:hypothetical protein L7F22_054626 [Adiantum nelumboides]|nr:hypothetical protein [Adiantum nelumboides]
MQPLLEGSSKIRKAATFLKTNALQWWTTLLNQGVVPSTWVQFKQIFTPAWITNTFEVDVMTAWNQLSANNCESLEEYNAKFWDALLPVSSFKMIPLAEQIEKYCCGLPKGIKKYCTKTSVMNMAQLMENAEVVDDLIQGKPDEDGFKTRRKEPQGKQFSAKGNVTSRLTVPPFKKKPFTGMILDLLKSYISDQKTQWERYLPLVEFAYNNTIHSSTGKAPFEIVEGAIKVPPSLSTKDKIFEADEYTRDLDTAFAKVRETLQKSQERQKKAADRHQRDLKLKENDWVLSRFEKARLRKKKGKERLYPKLSMRYYGPFQITERINDVSFRLRLPDTWKIHNAFHVSLLKPFRGDVPDDGEPDEQPEVEENEEILVPEQILAHKDTKMRNRGRLQCFQEGDLTLRCCRPDLRSQSSRCHLDGIAIATCCHHICQWKPYVNKEFFKQLGFSKKEFYIITWLTSGAVSGIKEHPAVASNHSESGRSEERDASTRERPTNFADLEEEKRVDSVSDWLQSLADKAEFGLKCKRLLDVGRFYWLKQMGMNAKLVTYVSPEVTPENTLLLASREIGGSD